jgi:hypothetical protein
MVNTEVHERLNRTILGLTGIYDRKYYGVDAGTGKYVYGDTIFDDFGDKYLVAGIKTVVGKSVNCKHIWRLSNNQYYENTGLWDVHGVPIYEDDYFLGYREYVDGYLRKSAPRYLPVLCQVKKRIYKFDPVEVGIFKKYAKYEDASHKYRGVWTSFCPRKVLTIGEYHDGGKGDGHTCPEIFVVGHADSDKNKLLDLDVSDTYFGIGHKLSDKYYAYSKE